MADTATAWAVQFRAPEWQHTGTKRVVGEAEKDVPTGRALISLHIHLLLSTCLLHLPLALKREANANLMTFFREVESVVTCAGRQTRSRVVVPQGAFCSALSSPASSCCS